MPLGKALNRITKYSKQKQQAGVYKMLGNIDDAESTVVDAWENAKLALEVDARNNAKLVLEVDAWKNARSVIEHENDLINHRLTWLFALQAFLFAAFFLFVQSVFGVIADNSSQPKRQQTVLQAGANNPLITGANNFSTEVDVPSFESAAFKLLSSSLVSFILLFIAFIGIVLSVTILQQAKVAQKHLNKVDEWFHRVCSEDIAMCYPPLQGKSDTNKEKMLSCTFIPSIFIVAWLLIYVLISVKGEVIVNATSVIALIFLMFKQDGLNAIVKGIPVVGRDFGKEKG